LVFSRRAVFVVNFGFYNVNFLKIKDLKIFIVTIYDSVTVPNVFLSSQKDSFSEHLDEEIRKKEKDLECPICLEFSGRIFLIILHLLFSLRRS